MWTLLVIHSGNIFELLFLFQELGLICIDHIYRYGIDMVSTKPWILQEREKCKVMKGCEDQTSTLTNRQTWQLWDRPENQSFKVHEMKWKPLSHVRLFATPWTVQSMEFSWPEHWSGSLFPSPGDLPNPGIKPRSPAFQADSLQAEPPGKGIDEKLLSWRRQCLCSFIDSTCLWNISWPLSRCVALSCPLNNVDMSYQWRQWLRTVPGKFFLSSFLAIN